MIYSLERLEREEKELGFWMGYSKGGEGEVQVLFVVDFLKGGFFFSQPRRQASKQAGRR